MELQKQFAEADLETLARFYFSGEEPRLSLAPYYNFDKDDPDEIIKFVCRVFGTDVKEFNKRQSLRSSSVTRKHSTFSNKDAQILCVLCYLFRHHSRHSFEKIAERVNLKSHASIIRYLKILEDWYGIEPDFKLHVDLCLTTISKDLLPLKEISKRFLGYAYQCVEDGKKFTTMQQIVDTYNISNDSIQESLDLGLPRGKCKKTFVHLK